MNRELFDQFYSAGVLDPGSEQYLWLPDMECFPPEEAKHCRNEYCTSGLLSGLTAFAVSGAGDLFCWDAHDRVWLVPPDAGMRVYYAASLGDAVYRRLLEFANDAFGNFCSDAEKQAMSPADADCVISQTEAISMLAEYDAGFQELLSDVQHDVLRALVRGGFDRDGVLLTDAACRALIGAILYPV